VQATRGRPHCGLHFVDKRRRRGYNRGMAPSNLPRARAARATRPASGGSALARALGTPVYRPHQTLAHRIADDLGVAIVDGELADGARICEEELAAQYGASRSPVRDAIALLERRGLVRTEPRRGAYVIGQSLDVIADLFNLRAALVGLAVRYIARRRDPEVLAQLRQAVAAVAAAAERPAISALAFAQLGGDAARLIVGRCGAIRLAQMLSDHASHSGWGMIWRKRALDFQTPERRRQYAQQYVRLADLIEDGADQDAELLMRHMMFESRDRVLAAITRAHGGAADAVHQLHDRAGAGVTTSALSWR
jgi:DNA-binding GntR family transcriptional regulator